MVATGERRGDDNPALHIGFPPLPFFFMIGHRQNHWLPGRVNLVNRKFFQPGLKCLYRGWYRRFFGEYSLYLHSIFTSSISHSSRICMKGVSAPSSLIRAGQRALSRRFVHSTTVEVCQHAGIAYLDPFVADVGNPYSHTCRGGR